MSRGGGDQSRTSPVEQRKTGRERERERDGRRQKDVFSRNRPPPVFCSSTVLIAKLHATASAAAAVMPDADRVRVSRRAMVHCKIYKYAVSTSVTLRKFYNAHPPDDREFHRENSGAFFVSPFEVLVHDEERIIRSSLGRTY